MVQDKASGIPLKIGGDGKELNLYKIHPRDCSKTPRKVHADRSNYLAVM